MNLSLLKLFLLTGAAQGVVVGILLLTVILEQVSGNTYDEALRTGLIDPLGLTETYYDLTDQQIASLPLIRPFEPYND